MGRLPYQETGRTFGRLRATRQNELFSFLFKILLQAFCKEDKDVVLTDEKGVISTQPLQDVHILAHAAMKKLIVVCYCTAWPPLDAHSHC